MTIGIIDFYGLLKIDESEVRALLPFEEGDRLAEGDLDPEALADELEQALSVERVELNGVCCSAPGAAIVFIGLEEQADSTPAYRSAPTGKTVLPTEISETSELIWAKLVEATQAGNSEEDQSQGHSLAVNPEIRALQLRYIDYARRYRDLLITVLHGSARQRALAARVLAYADDKASIVPHLERAVLDPNETVRNDATRALALIATYANEHPELGIEIDAGLFIRMLSSVVWTDRNKASFVLEPLTASRDPARLDRLREAALPALIEMCAWRSLGHAFPSCVILERILGLPEQDELYPREQTIALARALLPAQ